MKKFVIFVLSILSFSAFALQVPGPDSTIYSEDIHQVVNTDNIDDPLRDGAFMAIDNSEASPGEDNYKVMGIVNEGEITEHDEAESSILTIIKNIINYSLSLLGLIALIYLIYHGFLMLTAAGDEEQYKRGQAGIKYAATALIGVGLSFFIISFIFWLLEKITIG